MILFLSNGHGEDLIGATLAAKLRRAAPEVEVKALAVVGEGKPYSKAGIPLVGPRRAMPSGGFTRNSLANLLADLRAGLLPLLLGQAAEVRRLGREVDLVVAVGDILVLYLARRQARRPTVFLPTAKSDYIAPHFAVEVALMRECLKVFPRDALTATHLSSEGVPAEYVGNAMMDCLDVSGANLRPLLGPAAFVVALLPGSRQEAYLNLEDLTAVAARLVGLVSQPMAFPVALAPALDPHRAAEAICTAGGEAVLLNAASHLAPLPGRDGHAPQPSSPRPVLTLVLGRFGDVVLASDLVVGLAGTANEQAAGLGRPVVAFPGRGAQFTPRFAAAQKKLLGEAVALVERDFSRVAGTAWRILNDPAEYACRAAAGRERMGGPGATDRIAEGIVTAWEEVRHRSV
ncbi:MAG: lipid-A-disaccharide synthase-related protein [Bacillota bacterium]|nr:lipid-A-disaccharide synthase-related protein [Bacillota bacterium]